MKINIIGTGNVASHLMKAFDGKAKTVQINSHTLEGLDPSADVTIISVTDRAIRDVASRLPEMKGIVAHTSGSVGMDALEGEAGINNYGVFYPLQTFSKNVSLQYDKIPFFIEGESDITTTKLLNLASLISDTVNVADSSKRKAIHVASVFACNFANFLWNCADTVLKENQLPFEILRPLLIETIRKTEEISPFDAQTGPARRNDTGVIESHLQMLSNRQELATIYELLSSSIRSHYHN